MGEAEKQPKRKWVRKVKPAKVKIGHESVKIMTAPHKAAKIEVGKAVKMYAEGKSQADIARFFQCDAAAVCRALAPYKEQIEGLRVYRESRDTWHELVSNKIVNAMLTKDMEAEKCNSLAGAFKVFNDARRLETGLSTGNHTITLVDLSAFSAAPQGAGRVIDIEAINGQDDAEEGVIVDE